MNSGGITEAIWHFIGLLHIGEEAAKARLILDGSPELHAGDGYSALVLKDGPARSGDFGATDSQGQSFDLDPGSPIAIHGAQYDSPTTPRIGASSDGKLAPPPHMHAPENDLGIEGDTQISIIHRHVAAAGSHALQGSHASQPFDPVSVTYAYHSGANDQIVLIRQENWLDENDHVQLGSRLPLSAGDLGPTIGRLLDVARSEIPDNYLPHIETAKSYADFVKSLGGGTDSVAPGRYVNGELQPADAPATLAAGEAKPPAVHDHPEQHPGDTGQVLVAGGNTAHNAALIADTNDLSGSLIVLGNHYKTTGIFQTNIYSDSDVVSVSQHDAHVTTGGDTANNIAALLETNLGSHAPGTPGGHLNVKVDVADGNYYDINWLKQYNVISENDVVSFNTSKTFSTVTAGMNTSENIGQMLSQGKHYDLIIVMGDFYSKDLIYQTNILLDNDVVTLGRLPPDAAADAKASGAAQTPGDGGAAHAAGDAGDSHLAQDVNTGGNTLLNDAKIWTLGGQTIMSVSPDMMNMITGLQGNSAIDPSTWWQFARSSSDTFTVGLFKGDYYNVNIVDQTNVVADDVTARLLVSTAVQDGQTGVTQSVQTGGNTLDNQAIIIDPGTAFSEHVNGHVYSDSMLIQTNIVDPHPSAVGHGDPNTVVPEFVAFATDQPASTASTDANDPHAGQHSATTHADGLGSVLS